MSADHRLQIRQDGRVLTVTFTNPPRHFFDEAMSVALDDLTRDLERDQTVGAVIFTGAGEHFVTHFDVPDLLRGSRSFPHVGYRSARLASAVTSAVTRSRTLDRRLRSTPARQSVFLGRIYRSLERLNRADAVTIAAVNGLALGMGCIFSLACDMRIIARDTQIGLPETGLAMLAGAGGTQRLVRMVGSSRALALLLTGDWIGAEHAHDIGLAYDVADRHEVVAVATDLAVRLARRSPEINREIRRSVLDAGSRRLSAGLRREAAGLVSTLTSRDSERCLTQYARHLSAGAELDDEYIAAGWRPLLDDGVPRTR